MTAWMVKGLTDLLKNPNSIWSMDCPNSCITFRAVGYIQSMSKQFFYGYSRKIWTICLLCLLITLSQCSTTRGDSTGGDLSDQWKELYLQDVEAFIESVKTFQSTTGSSGRLETFIEMRVQFKEIEFLMEYLDAQRHAYFNEAPVLKEESVMPTFAAIQPRGLQVIEAELCSDQPDHVVIQQQTQLLLSQGAAWKSYLDGLELDRDMFLLAAIQHLNRIESLSLSGFEHTCVDIVPAEIISWSEAFQQYAQLIAPEDMALQQLLTDIRSAWETDFHYVRFIRYQIQPLRKRLVTKVEHFPAWPNPVKWDAVSLYEPDFLEASFYGSSGILIIENSAIRQLGESLFHDTRLSANGKMSCATCHEPSNFFQDGRNTALAIDGSSSLARNTPSLIHNAYQELFMYDGRASSMEDQMLHVFAHDAEFQMHTTAVIDRITKSENYSDQFDRVFPEMRPQSINMHSVTTAIATYTRSLDGSDSPLDQYMRGELQDLPAPVLDGFHLFMTKAECGTCHFPPAFGGLLPPLYVDSEFENLGVPVIDERGDWSVDPDQGRYLIYRHEAFRHFFKTTTVRNSGETAPYMHNGVFGTLDEVLSFYNDGGGLGHGLNYENQTLPEDSLGLNQSEIEQLKAFMHALTDSTYFGY